MKLPARFPNPETATAPRSDEKPEEGDGDICLSLNPASRKLARRLVQATLGRLNRTGAVAMVTLFSACSLPEPRKPAIIQYFGWGERERWMRRERNSPPNAYIIHICPHLCFLSYFSPVHTFFSIYQQRCASLWLS